jgi:ankyrin repeat protein
MAAQEGREAVARELLDASGIDVNLTSTEGTTAISAAWEQGHEQIVNLLLATPNIADDRQKTSLAINAEVVEATNMRVVKTPV